MLMLEMQDVVRHERYPTRKSDETQPNDTRNCRTVSLSNTFLRPQKLSLKLRELGQSTSN